MKKIFCLIFFGFFALFMSSCISRLVQGKYVITRMETESLEVTFGAERDVAYFVECKTCGKEQWVKFQVGKEYFDVTHRGDTIVLDGRYPLKYVNFVGRWYDIRKSGY